MRPERAWLLSLLLITPTLVRAQEAADIDLEQLRPSGPVTLAADSADWVQGGTAEYSGNVSLSSDNLSLRGDSMSVTQYEGNHFQARILGGPAQLDHAGVVGAGALAAQPVAASARQIDYDSRNGVVHLEGDAQLMRGTDRISGEQIDYIVTERRIRASGGQGGQVRIVIQPPTPKNETQP